MADYTFPQVVLSRVRYYDGEFLLDQDFVDEQHYHIDRRQRHERLLHVAGILEGLDVALQNPTTAFTVSAGAAVDALGRQILLDTVRTIDVDDGWSGNLWITVRFYEKEDRDADPNSPVEQKTRFTQDPVIEVVADIQSIPSNQYPMVLGRLLSVSNGEAQNVTTEGRVYSGVRIPGPNGASYALRAKGNTAPGWVELGSSLSVTQDASVGGKLSVTGEVGIGTANPAARLDVAGLVKAQSLEVAGNVGIGTGNPSARLDVVGNGSVTGMLTVTQDASLATASGNVGIGTTNPAYKLHVVGDGLLTGGLTVTGPTKIHNDLDLPTSNLGFGSTVRQMINLWGTDYGIGVQSSTTYFRTGGHFGFYRHGSHSVAALDAGGGQALMVLKASGHVGIGTTDPQTALHVAGDITMGKNMLRLGTPGGTVAQLNEVVGTIGFWGYSQQHGQMSFRAGKGFEFVDRSSDGPSLAYNEGAHPYTDIHVKGVFTTNKVGIGDWTLESAGTFLYIKCGSQIVARLSSTDFDRLLVFQYTNGFAPYFFFNAQGNYGVYTPLQVPNLINVSKTAALAALQTAGLVPQPNGPGNIVSAQNPPAGTIVNSGSPVTFELFKSVVPNVINPILSKSAADAAIQSAGFGPPQFNGPGTIVSAQNLAPGTVANVSTPILLDVLLSVVPNVINPILSKSAADAAIQSAGFGPPQFNGPGNMVSGQNPPPGVIFSVNNPVVLDVFLSLVPNVMWLMGFDAYNQLDAAGFQVNVYGSYHSTVTYQEPSGGVVPVPSPAIIATDGQIP